MLMDGWYGDDDTMVTKMAVVLMVMALAVAGCKVRMSW